MKTKLIPIIALSMTLSLTACVKHTIDTAKLSDLERLSSQTVNKDTATINNIRLQALRDTAMTIGAQSGLSDRAQQINALLEIKGQHLSQVFNFDGMMLAHNVLPPVLIAGRHSLNLASTESIRIADITYEILSQAKFVTTPPNWHNYLWMDYKKPSIPNASLLPKNQAERKVWKKYIAKGWRQGGSQADAIFKENLARLKRDYEGMVLYRKLLAQNIVSAPYVAKTDLGITGDSTGIRVNDQVLRITALPLLQVDSKRWQPAFSQQSKATK